MGKELWIKRASVEGLHQQFDVNLTFNPGLNIIYGKNGTGKTTILHLLANALECDFRRFAFIQFRRISIESNLGGIVEIVKDQSPHPSVKINGSVTTFTEANQTLSEAELASIRDVLGGRPTYLPAFRSILERTRTDYPNTYYRPTDRQDPEYTELVQRELTALKELTRAKSLTSWEQRNIEEAAGSTAWKSTLCRQWFGRFVPVIRYPSVSEVEEALTEEWRVAQFEFTHRERQMFEETFVKVFRTIAGIEKPTSAENNDDLLASIASLLKNQESELGSSESSDIYNALVAAVRATDTSAVSRGVDNSVLDIYRQVLERRNKERRAAFQRSRDFAASVNKFLEGKTFTIGVQRSQAARTRNGVSVVTEGGHSYGISALSSGERQILTMLYSASRTKFLSSVFLIDEPELSLHIDWQRIVLRELQNQAPNCQIIACTHSPEVGADHFDQIQDFEPRLTRQQPSLFPEEDL